jgi:protein phosphatase
VGTVLHVKAAAQGTVTIEERVATRGLKRFFRGVDGAGTALTVVEEVTTPPPPATLHIPDRRVLRAIHEQPGHNGGLVRVFERPAAISVAEWLQDRAHPTQALDVLTFGLHLTDVLSNIHGAGFCLLSLDADSVLRTPQLDVVLTNVEDLPRPGELPRTVVAATAAPEVLHRMAPLAGVTSDVYSVAALLHALLAQRDLYAPPQGMSAVMCHQYAPRVWRQNLPLGIWPRLARALDPDPARRLPHMAALKEALQQAMEMVSRRYAPRPPRPLALDAWADSHVGVGKARRAGDQQDRLFCGLGSGGVTALAAVADGVSHATLGDGGRAAEHTAVAVRAMFETFSQGPTAPPQGVTDPFTHRHEALNTVLARATEAIAEDANANLSPLKGDTSGVMASTLVMAWVEAGTASFLNVGDSRAYLYDGATLESVTIDHDRKTESVRGGLDPYSAGGLEAGGALTRAVGRVVTDAEGKLVASPSPADFMDLPLLPGDRLLLCSDGLPDYCVPPGTSLLSPVGVEEVLFKVLKAAPDPPEAAHALIGLANRNGGHDNIAVVLVFLGGRAD